jgi:peptidoglycan/xylan/chitin deacetylase (PgdA/CDA1 family)
VGIPVTVFVCTAYADRGGAPLTVPELATEDPAELEGLATLAWDDLRALRERGIEIGSHTETHPWLTQLGDRALDAELRDSKRRVEDELGHPCRTLAYPYGDWDARVAGVARAVGYERAYALHGDPRNPYALPRVDLYRRDTPARAVLKTTRARSLLERIDRASCTDYTPARRLTVPSGPPESLGVSEPLASRGGPEC